MARKVRADTDMSAPAGPSANAGHNSAQRAKIMREAAQSIIALKAEKSSIQEQITEERGRVKGLGIKMQDFNVALRLLELEAEDRNESLDGLREAFSALGVHEQLDWLTATGADAAPQPTTGLRDAPSGNVDIAVARAAGREAGRAGKAAIDNPHPSGADRHTAWLEGWKEGQAEIAESMGPDGDAPAPDASERRPVNRKAANGAAAHA